MTLRESPVEWRQGFSLYRRRIREDSFGNEVAEYPEEPDEICTAQEGLAFQSPRAWNSAGQVGAVGASTEVQGESAGGVLEACLRGSPEIAPFDRLLIGDALWEVRAVRQWPEHRELVLQRMEKGS